MNADAPLSPVTPSPAQFDGEKPLSGGGVTSLCYFRPGDARQPLVLFLPGGGHLARVVYGHGGARREDFLDFWLERRGLGLMALSYPGGHPAVGAAQPDLTISAWADHIAWAVAETRHEGPLVIAMWSMAGRSVRTVNQALLSKGFAIDCFVSLAATPPLPGLMPLTTGGEPLTEDGLWAIGCTGGGPTARGLLFLTDLAGQDRGAGRAIIARDDYLCHYLSNTPIMLRGVSQRWSGGTMGWDAGAALADMGVDRFQEYPLTAVIAPTDPIDGHHVLGDRAGWGFLNVQKLMAATATSEGGGGLVDRDCWTRFSDLINAIPQRLHRSVPGGHFFFVGEGGARETVRQMVALSDEVRAVRAEIQSCLRPTAEPPC